MREDPREILRAARDADMVAHCVLELELELELEKERTLAANEAQVVEAQLPGPVQQSAARPRAAAWRER